MITKQKYVEYLVSTPINYTCSNLAEHLEGMSHDVVSDFLKRERLTARHLWELVAEQIDDSADAYLILDDSVQDKRYARSIEMVKLQYSGAEGGLVRGIGVRESGSHQWSKRATIIRSISASTPKRRMGSQRTTIFKRCCCEPLVTSQIQAKTVLFDSWYGLLAEPEAGSPSGIDLLQPHSKPTAWSV